MELPFGTQNAFIQCSGAEGFFLLRAAKSASRVGASVKRHSSYPKTLQNSSLSFLQPWENDKGSTTKIISKNLLF
jgi:hypothetical protein